uniref:MARVEL domain-containing protein n=1 Tax=Parastrongyloides trichosuri TaxID=131310 RepID=A0A0N4Z6W3_PARTI
MIDKKIKIRGVIFLFCAVGGLLAIWSMLATLSYGFNKKYSTTSIALTSVIVVSSILNCFIAIFQVREEYKSIVHGLLGLSILITVCNIIHAFVIPIRESNYLVLALSLAASIDGIICILSAGVLRYYFGIPIPTDKWYCRNSWP